MKKVDYTVSMIRFVSLLMIISCHILQGINNPLAFWVNLGVQIFFFMSGYLYGKKEIKNYEEFYHKRFLKIAIPNAILVIVIMGMNCLLFDQKYASKFFIANVLGLGGFVGTITELTHTWFVSYILLCYLFTPFLQVLFLHSKNHVKTLIKILVIILFFQLFNMVNFNVAWLCNYVLGYYFTKCCTKESHKKVFFYSLMVSTIFVLPISLILQYQLISNIPLLFTTYQVLICSIEHVLLGSLLFLLFYRFQNKNKRKYNLKS